MRGGVTAVSSLPSAAGSPRGVEEEEGGGGVGRARLSLPSGLRHGNGGAARVLPLAPARLHPRTFPWWRGAGGEGERAPVSLSVQAARPHSVVAGGALQPLWGRVGEKSGVSVA